MKLRDAIESRASVRKFHHKKPDWRKVIRAIDAARFAPSAGNQFVMRFIMVSDEKKIKEIAQEKMVDLNTDDIEAAMRIIEGTARSMGIDIVEG